MRADTHEKVNAGHLKRNAYLYVRQTWPWRYSKKSRPTGRRWIGCAVSKWSGPVMKRIYSSTPLYARGPGPPFSR